MCVFKPFGEEEVAMVVQVRPARQIVPIDRWIRNPILVTEVQLSARYRSTGDRPPVLSRGQSQHPICVSGCLKSAREAVEGGIRGGIDVQDQFNVTTRELLVPPIGRDA